METTPANQSNSVHTLPALRSDPDTEMSTSDHGNDVMDGTESINDPTVFKPIYTVGYWEDPDDNDNPCASVAILNFSGIDRRSDFSVNIVHENILELKILRPECLTVSRILHSVWLTGKGNRKKLEEYHGMLKSFESMLAPLRRFNNRIETTARIPLQMRVESRPEVHLLAFPNTTARIIYVLLRGPACKVSSLIDDAIEWEQ